MLQEFPHKQRLIAALDAAIACGDEQQVVAALERRLSELALPDGIPLPDELRHPIADHYARREIHRSREFGYSVVVMTWGPGQGTPIHDHDTHWCVEGVWQGRLEVCEFDVTAQASNRFRLCRRRVMAGGVGSTSSLLPPAEFHSVRNPDPEQAAVSLHVYQRPLQHFGVYLPEAPDSPWHLRHDRVIATDH